MTPLAYYGPGILIAYATFILATISPGPALLSTMGTAMGSGRKAGVALGLGVVCGSFTWGMLAALGLSSVLASWPGALDIIRIAGCLYLLFLAFKAFRSATSRHDPLAPPSAKGTSGPGGHFLRGWGIHLTNPKAILAWIAIISLGLKPGAPVWVVVILLGGTMAFAILFYTSAAIAFSTPVMVRLYSRAQRGINAVLGLFFVFAAIRLVIG
ncbi:MAG: LysE family translocator [Pseudomonadota bacterium]